MYTIQPLPLIIIPYTHTTLRICFESEITEYLMYALCMLATLIKSIMKNEIL